MDGHDNAPDHANYVYYFFKRFGLHNAIKSVADFGFGTGTQLESFAQKFNPKVIYGLEPIVFFLREREREKKKYLMSQQNVYIYKMKAAFPRKMRKRNGKKKKKKISQLTHNSYVSCVYKIYRELQKVNFFKFEKEKKIKDDSENINGMNTSALDQRDRSDSCEKKTEEEHPGLKDNSDSNPPASFNTIQKFIDYIPQALQKMSEIRQRVRRSHQHSVGGEAHDESANKFELSPSKHQSKETTMIHPHYQQVKQLKKRAIAKKQKKMNLCLSYLLLMILLNRWDGMFNLGLFMSVGQYLGDEEFELVLFCLSLWCDFLYMDVVTTEEYEIMKTGSTFQDPYAIQRGKSWYLKIITKFWRVIGNSILESKFLYDDTASSSIPNVLFHVE
ncbi:hypothetical protein RFI_15292 [Reticulomyxa filosa]|uniref:Uncharacterized protein n=1 Tax=Reticulomyxa filosa TaxID=46433 RepID=X6N7P4_RETFI|nr:hypothetical protein RFI_15292 [Reticulomyxa filosa]|eukprot:ETO21908.1 hypothetical protein RFI_15292 [Reticulomyxa filosa]